MLRGVRLEDLARTLKRILTNFLIANLAIKQREHFDCLSINLCAANKLFEKSDDSKR